MAVSFPWPGTNTNILVLMLLSILVSILVLISTGKPLEIDRKSTGNRLETDRKPIGNRPETDRKPSGNRQENKPNKNMSSSRKRLHATPVQNGPVYKFTALTRAIFMNLSVFLSQDHFRATFETNISHIVF